MTEAHKLSLGEIGILEICCEIETSCAELYMYFSELYKDDDRISKLWKKTAGDEENHAEQFRFACRLLGTNIKTVKTNAERVISILEKIRSVHNAVKNNPPSIRDSLRFAINLEESLATYHMDTIIAFEDPHLMNLFVSMKNGDIEHIQMLQKAFDSL